MKSIWYLVGLVLMSIGTIIFIQGVIDTSTGNPGSTILASLYPNLWWGGVMIVFGAILYLTQRKKVVS